MNVLKEVAMDATKVPLFSMESLKTLGDASTATRDIVFLMLWEAIGIMLGNPEEYEKNYRDVFLKHASGPIKETFLPLLEEAEKNAKIFLKKKTALPIVSKETIYSAENEMAAIHGGSDEMPNFLGIIAENPLLMQTIERLSDASSDSYGVKVCAALIYRALQIQAKSDDK